jgi:hypothetical protein
MESYVSGDHIAKRSSSNKLQHCAYPMNSKNPVDLCIQVEPNRLGIDYARITLTDRVAQRLVHLCKLLDPYQLDSVACIKSPVQWYKAGQLLVSPCLATCTLTGSVRDADLVLYVDGFISGEIDRNGVYSRACEVRGHWMFCSLSELEDERLLEQADAHGDIHATSDYGTPMIEVISRDAELRHALYLSRHNAKNPQVMSFEDTAWPDPFDRWPDSGLYESRAHLRVPKTFAPEVRTPLADAVLAKLFQAMLMQDWDPNQRCAFYTLAAALIICPQEVTLTRSNGDIPLFLRNLQQEVFPNENPLCIEDVAVPRQTLCGTCGFVFDFNTLIRLRYKNILVELTLDAARTVIAASWSTTHQVANLALLYEDHANNDFAWRLMHEFAAKYTDDLSRLKLLALGLDALKRLLDDESPWCDDVPHTTEARESWRKKIEKFLQMDKS